jgi:hypothetical protein
MHWINAENISSLIPIFGMLIPIVAIISGVIQSRHEKSERYETIRTLARAGQPIPPELLRGLRKGQDQDPDDQQPQTNSRRMSNSLKSGIILISVGAGIACSLYLFDPSGLSWGAGLIPLFLGVGFIVIYLIEKPRA